jgi:hypothetical protein
MRRSLVESAYLTAYDYGQGGVWTFIVAESPEAIREKYPQLEIVAEPPPWMLEHGVEKIRTVHISDSEDPFLAALRDETS